jgi:hypothetical protein
MPFICSRQIGDGQLHVLIALPPQFLRHHFLGLYEETVCMTQLQNFVTYQCIVESLQYIG